MRLCCGPGDRLCGENPSSVPVRQGYDSSAVSTYIHGRSLSYKITCKIVSKLQNYMLQTCTHLPLNMLYTSALYGVYTYGYLFRKKLERQQDNLCRHTGLVSKG